MHGWFSDQTVLVLTHSPASVSAPGRAVRSVEEAIELAATAGAAELVVAGGAEVFALALPYATRLVLTRVHLRSGGTVLFPPINEMDWRVIDERLPSRRRREPGRLHHPDACARVRCLNDEPNRSGGMAGPARARRV